MNILIIYTHPNPQSFNHALMEYVKAGLESAGHLVNVRDLYGEPFKATLDGADFTQLMNHCVPPDIKREQELISAAQGLVFIYPIWWYGPPAALKGWIDRVFLEGFAYAISQSGLIGLLKHRKALVFNTAGSPQEGFDNLLNIGAFTQGVLRTCGIEDIQVKTFWSIPHLTLEERQAVLAEAKALASSAFPV